MAPPPRVGIAAQAVCTTVTPSGAFRIPTPDATWSSANSAASLTTASRDDQLAQPSTNLTTGEYLYYPEATVSLIRPVLRGGAAGHTVTFNVWYWWQIYQDGSNTPYGWSPWLAGRFLATFKGAGTETNGFTAGPVIATDIYASLLSVVATYDRRGGTTDGYTGLWKFLQPAVDDGSPAMLMLDNMGAPLITLEGRTTTNGELFNFAVSGLTAV